MMICSCWCDELCKYNSGFAAVSLWWEGSNETCFRQETNHKRTSFPDCFSKIDTTWCFFTGRPHLISRFLGLWSGHKLTTVPPLHIMKYKYNIFITVWEWKRRRVFAGAAGVVVLFTWEDWNCGFLFLC